MSTGGSSRFALGGVARRFLRRPDAGRGSKFKVFGLVQWGVNLKDLRRGQIGMRSISPLQVTGRNPRKFRLQRSGTPLLRSISSCRGLHPCSSVPVNNQPNERALNSGHNSVPEPVV